MHYSGQRAVKSILVLLLLFKMTLISINERKEGGNFFINVNYRQLRVFSFTASPFVFSQLDLAASISHIANF